jgi:hypothetical protein
LTRDLREARSYAAEVRIQSQNLRMRNRKSMRSAEHTLRDVRVRRHFMLVPSPWSDLAWHLPVPGELDQVLVSVAGEATRS